MYPATRLDASGLLHNEPQEDSAAAERAPPRAAAAGGDISDHETRSPHAAIEGETRSPHAALKYFP
eukprot:scaffold11205_cov55-Phaeocystis_antarctica.AAC.1